MKWTPGSQKITPEFQTTKNPVFGCFWIWSILSRNPTVSHIGIDRKIFFSQISQIKISVYVKIQGCNLFGQMIFLIQLFSILSLRFGFVSFFFLFFLVFIFLRLIIPILLRLIIHILLRFLICITTWSNNCNNDVKKLSSLFKISQSC